MAITVSKLVSAAMLQDFIIGKDAQPLVAGIITMYRDNDHFTLKNWYYQTGNSPPYTEANYATLPNPMTLSAAGTMQDVNGNDIIPFYYPWNEDDDSVPEPYFVTVYNSLGMLEFTRSNFPFLPPNDPGPEPTSPESAENVIMNSRFWRNANVVNAGTLPAANNWTVQYGLGQSVFYFTVAPDQHDGFSMPDINYIKSLNGSCTETITFQTFPKQTTPVLMDDIQPEFYINHNCTADSSGSVLKTYQFPVSLHLATLASQNFSFTLQAKAESGSPILGIYMYAFCGTGVTSPVAKFLGNIALTNTWEKYELTALSFQSTLGLILGSDGTGGNDDAFYLQIRLPTQSLAVCNVDFCLPSIYLTTEDNIPTNSFQTYDQIDSIIAAARTGDIKTSINNFYPYGWVPMSGGTIAHPNTATTLVAPTGLTIAYQGYDAWALYDMVWNKFSGITYGGAPLIGVYTSAGAASTFGTSSYADWNALKQITITDTMGQVIMGTVPPSAMTSFYQQNFTASNSGGFLLLTFATPTFAFIGMPLTVVAAAGSTLPTGLVANTVYFVAEGTTFSSTTFLLSRTFAGAISGIAGNIIPYVDDGMGGKIFTSTFVPNGSYEGEYGHFQLAPEVGAHTHTAAIFDAGSFVTHFAKGTNANQASATTDLNVHSLPFNVVQPSIFYNMFIKL